MDASRPIPDMNRPATAPSPAERLDFEAFARETYPSVLAYLRSRTRNPELARDLAQESFLQAYRDRHRFDPARGGTLEWIIGIARNVSASAARRQGRHARELPQLEATTEGAWSGARPPAAPDARLEALDRCLGELAGRSREILRLLYENGTGYAEISERLGMGQSAVKVAALRARQALSDCVRRRLEARGGRS